MQLENEIIFIVNPRFVSFGLRSQFNFFSDGDEMALSSSTILSLVASTSLSMSSLPYPSVSIGFRTLFEASMLILSTVTRYRVTRQVDY